MPLSWPSSPAAWVPDSRRWPWDYGRPAYLVSVGVGEGETVAVDVSDGVHGSIHQWDRRTNNGEQRAAAHHRRPPGTTATTRRQSATMRDYRPGPTAVDYDLRGSGSAGRSDRAAVEPRRGIAVNFNVVPYVGRPEPIYGTDAPCRTAMAAVPTTVRSSPIGEAVHS